MSDTLHEAEGEFHRRLFGIEVTRIGSPRREYVAGPGEYIGADYARVRCAHCGGSYAAAKCPSCGSRTIEGSTGGTVYTTSRTLSDKERAKLIIKLNGKFAP